MEFLIKVLLVFIISYHSQLSLIICFIFRLSIGTNDGFIKLLDLSKPNIKKVNLTNFYQKIQSKVTSLAWHPSKDLYLAYGTLEGRVSY